MNDTQRPEIIGPHRNLAGDAPRERFLARLFDALWDRYRSRVAYVRQYEEVVARHGGTFVNDHIAFRTFGCQSPTVGVGSLSRIFEALGYRSAGTYHFEDKHLSAIHFQHPNGRFPKLFISELKTWELPASARQIIREVLIDHRPPAHDDLLADLAGLDQSDLNEAATQDLLTKTINLFLNLPWPAPQRALVTAINAVSQYAAWVLVHGYNVNHFTSLVNSHGVDTLDNLEKTISALQQAAVPMKAEIEGEPGSKLRQSATEAVKIDVDVRDGDAAAQMPWSYAYFELAERNAVVDPESGKRVRFEGFLGPQATNLFEMTRIGGS